MTGRIRTFWRSSRTGRFIRRQVAEEHPRQSTKETYKVPESEGSRIATEKDDADADQ